MNQMNPTYHPIGQEMRTETNWWMLTKKSQIGQEFSHVKTEDAAEKEEIIISVVIRSTGKIPANGLCLL